MLRNISRLALCAVLGLSTSVAVAWGLAIRGEARVQWDESARVAWTTTSGEVVTLWKSQQSPGFYHLRLMRGQGKATATQIRADLGGGLRMGEPAPYSRVPGPPRECHPPVGRANCRSEFQVGWPAPCMWAANDEDAPGGCMITTLGNQHVLRVWPLTKRGATGGQSPLVEDWVAPFCRYPGHQNWYVPTGVLARGLTIDSAAYASCWWLILLAPGVARRAFRRHHHLCPTCAYPIGASPVCTECGKPVPTPPRG